MKLFIDILRLKVMMTGMSESRTMKAEAISLAATSPYLHGKVCQRPSKEETMMKVMSVVIAAALLAALLAGVTRVVANARVAAREQGMMPEVVVRAETPRLVMHTVEVRAYGNRSVAMNDSGVNIN